MSSTISLSDLPASFQRLAGANIAAQSAEQLSLAATPIVAVLLLAAGPGEIGMLAAAQTLPFLLLSIPFGLIADRRSRRKLMAMAEVLRAVSLLGLTTAVVLAKLSIALLAILGFVGAVGTVAFSVAAPALVPALVPNALLARANGWLELARSLAFTAGPALAGAMVSWTGAAPAFVLAAVLSGVSLVLLFGVREPGRTLCKPRHPLLELRSEERRVGKECRL